MPLEIQYGTTDSLAESSPDLDSLLIPTPAAVPPPGYDVDDANAQHDFVAKAGDVAATSRTGLGSGRDQ